MTCRLEQYDDRVDVTEKGKHQWSRARELQGPTYKPLKDAFWYADTNPLFCLESRALAWKCKCSVIGDCVTHLEPSKSDTELGYGVGKAADTATKWSPYVIQCPGQRNVEKGRP